MTKYIALLCFICFVSSCDNGLDGIFGKMSCTAPYYSSNNNERIPALFCAGDSVLINGVAFARLFSTTDFNGYIRCTGNKVYWIRAGKESSGNKKLHQQVLFDFSEKPGSKRVVDADTSTLYLAVELKQILTDTMGYDVLYNYKINRKMPVSLNLPIPSDVTTIERVFIHKQYGWVQLNYWSFQGNYSLRLER